MGIIRKSVFWLIMAFFVTAIFSMTIGQVIPIDLANEKYSNAFYDFVLNSIPVAILLTLVWSIKPSQSNKRRNRIVMITFLITIGAFILTFPLRFLFGYGAWINYEDIYENKNNSSITITHQLWDIGALGYGKERIVQLTPFLKFWHIVAVSDTSSINEKEWKYVRQEGDIKFP